MYNVIIKYGGSFQKLKIYFTPLSKYYVEDCLKKKNCAFCIKYFYIDLTQRVILQMWFFINNIICCNFHVIYIFPIIININI